MLLGRVIGSQHSGHWCRNLCSQFCDTSDMESAASDQRYVLPASKVRAFSGMSLLAQSSCENAALPCV